MKKTTLLPVLIIFIFLLPASIGAVDFGFIINQYAGLGNSEQEDTEFEYQAGFVPRISFLIGDSASFFASAAMTIGYSDEFYYVPELLRTEFAMQSGAIGFRIGRFGYSDPLSFIAGGLFDGIQLTHSSAIGRFSFGTWYTGLLYKKNANVVMTIEDQILYSSPLDYGEFFDTYFAPRRLIASIDWEHPAIGELVRLNASVLGQVDVTKNELYKIHTQYLNLKLGLPVGRLLAELGGSFEVAQVKPDGGDLDFHVALAGMLGLYWRVPTSFDSRLSFTGHYSSGQINDSFGAFTPVTARDFGEIFSARMTGLTVMSLDYTARVHDKIGAGFSVSYFIRNDLVTNNSFPLAAPPPVNASGEEEKNYFLGGEFYGRLIWSPVSDLQFSLGGGAFLPALGNVWSDGKTLWRLDLTAVLAVF